MAVDFPACYAQINIHAQRKTLFLYDIPSPQHIFPHCRRLKESPVYFMNSVSPLNILSASLVASYFKERSQALLVTCKIHCQRTQKDTVLISG